MTNDERRTLITYLCSLPYSWPTDTSPAAVAKHFRKCPECGGWVDLRRLSEALEHEAPGHEAAATH